MVTLTNFYKTKEWTKLVQRLRLDRTNSNGDILCEYCNRPIVNKYDCIGHHKQYLNDANVNDASIALNPDNIAFVHHVCHNKIHNKFGFKERQVYLVYGAPLSGKTSYVNRVMNEGDLVVDIDNIWECVSGCERYVKPARLNSIVFGMRDYLIDCVKFRKGKWDNAYVVGGYALSGERERLVDRLGAREIFIDTSIDKCIERLAKSSDGRNIEEWMKYIFDWFEKYTPPL